MLIYGDVIDVKTLAKVVEIAPNIYWVGAVDWHRRIFDALINLPYGTSYNAYLVKGKEKTVLIDTVNPGFEEELFKKVDEVVEPKRIDYLIMNHAEPDHAGAIPKVLLNAEDAKLVATKFGVEMARVFYDVPSERVEAVRDGDVLDLGGKTLTFMEAPMLHWPETMFTFCEEDAVLFPCDFFGAHLASDKLFDDEVGELLLPEAKRYYAEIMMPFSASIKRGLDKVANLDIKMIAPSHGPIYRNPRRIIDAYEKWARGPLEHKALLIYVSMWGSIDTLAKTIAEAVSAEGVEVVPHNLVVADISHIARDLVDANAVIIGSPTLLGGAHPLATLATELVRILRPRAKLAAIFGSYGWGGGATNRIRGQLEPAGFNIVGTVEVQGPPKKEDLERAVSLGRLVARKIKERT